MLYIPTKREVCITGTGYKLKGLRYLIFLLIVFIPSVATAISSQYGDSGLISVPTAETTERGIYNASVWFNDSQNNEKNAARFPVSIAMGIGFGWEFFGSYPDISFANQDNDSSMRSFESVGAKFRLTGGPDSNFKTSGTAFLRQTVSREGAESGLRDMGSRVIMSYSLPNADLHFNIGYLKVDSPATKKYNNEVLFGSAAEFPISNKMKAFLEMDGNTNRDGGSSRIELSPGMQYYLLPSISMMGGIGVGFGDIGPDYRVVVGLTFSSGAGKYVKAIPIIPGSRERYAAMATGSIEELIPELPTETMEGVAKVGDVNLALIGGPEVEKSEVSPTPESPVSTTVPGAKPGSKEILTPGGLITPAAPDELSTEAFAPPAPIATGETAPIEMPSGSLGMAEAHPLPVVEPPVPAGAATEEENKGILYRQILFFPPSGELTPFTSQVLDKVAKEIKGFKEPITVKIEGHTDSTGSASFNQKLSIRRADSVKNYFVKKHGIDPGIFVIKGYGADKPAASNATAEGRRENRRAVVIILPKEPVVNKNAEKSSPTPNIPIKESRPSSEAVAPALPAASGEKGPLQPDTEFTPPLPTEKIETSRQAEAPVAEPVEKKSIQPAVEPTPALTEIKGRAEKSLSAPDVPVDVSPETFEPPLPIEAVPAGETGAQTDKKQ